MFSFKIVPTTAVPDKPYIALAGDPDTGAIISVFGKDIPDAMRKVCEKVDQFNEEKDEKYNV